MSRRTLATVVGVVAVVALLFLTLSWRDVADLVPTDDPTPTYAGSARPTPTGMPSDAVDPDSGLPWIEVADLPVQAQATLTLVDAGGPFPYPGKDGSTFGNFEGRLPQHPRGYYAEYTVPTPGSRDRGARRIITGDGGEYYWTADHYSHFARIRR